MELTEKIEQILISALPSAQLPINWIDMGLTQLGLDSLSLMALAQALNQKFEINGNIGITPADVFMIGRARELVELVSQKLENEEDEEEEDKEEEEENEENDEDTEEGEENEERDTEEEEFKEDEKEEDEEDDEEHEKEREEESDEDVDKNEEEEEQEEGEEDGKLEEEQNSEDNEEDNRVEEAQNKNEFNEEEDGYETEDEEEEEENEENFEGNLPASKEDQYFKLARECIFAVEEFNTEKKPFNENPNVWIEISNQKNFEIIFKIKRMGDKEIEHSIDMKNIKNNQKFEENVEMLFGIIYERNEVEMEKDKVN